LDQGPSFWIHSNDSTGEKSVERRLSGLGHVSIYASVLRDGSLYNSGTSRKLPRKRRTASYAILATFDRTAIWYTARVNMFIGIIGTRYSGKSSVIAYLKTRGFTVLQLRSATNDEDTSTAASSDDDGKQDMSHESGNVNSRKSIDKTGMMASTSSALSINQAAAGPSDSLADLSGKFWS
jgi:hypothetical protein